MKCFNEKNYTSYLHDIGIQIYNKLVNMGLGIEISFHEFLLELQIGKNIYLLALQCTLWKPILFLKRKPCAICTNVLNIHVGPIWGANTYVHFILDMYVANVYCIFYLKK